MPNAAENMDFMEAGDDQLGKLQAQETDTATVIQINELRQDIVSQLSRAEEEGVISRRDVKKWSNILKEKGGSKREVADIQHQVSAVIEESKRLIAELPGGDKEVDIFKQMSLREKKEYIGNLRKAANDLNGRADKLGELFPDAAEKLKTMRGPERAKYIEELNIRRANVIQYGAFLEKYSRHFSKKSQKEFMDMFKELSISKQSDWLSQFVETQAGPRIKLSERFLKLPLKYKERMREQYGEFSEMSRHDKENVVKKGEEEKAFADKLYGNPDYKYMASKSRKFMKKTFIGADANLRKAMMEMLDKTIKDEAELGKKFEALTPKARNRCTDFMEKDFEEKTKVLDELMVKDYEDRLTPWLKKKVIGESTVSSFMAWFKELDVKGKMAEGPDEKIEGQMVDRIALKARFEDKKEMPEDVQKANAHFYNLGQHERMDLFEKLKRAQAEKKNGAEVSNEDAVTAAVAEKKKAADRKPVGGTVEGVVVGEKGAANEIGAELNEAKVMEEVKKVKEGSGLMKKRIRDKNIGEGLADLAASSDRANQDVYDSARKDKHLSDSKERDLNDQLVKFTGGKMVAGSGHEKARKVKEIDADKLAEGVVREEEIFDWKKDIVNNQGEKARDVFNVQFVDKKSGQKLSGVMGKQKVKEQQKGIQEDITDEVLQRLGMDVANDNAAKKEKVRSIVRKDKLKVDLKEASGF